AIELRKRNLHRLPLRTDLDLTRPARVGEAAELDLHRPAATDLEPQPAIAAQVHRHYRAAAEREQRASARMLLVRQPGLHRQRMAFALARDDLGDLGCAVVAAVGLVGAQRVERGAAGGLLEIIDQRIDLPGRQRGARVAGRQLRAGAGDLATGHIDAFDAVDVIDRLPG